MKKCTVFLFVAFIALNAKSQITVNSLNNVGVGTTNPVSKFSVNSDGNSTFAAYFYNPVTTGTNNMAIGGQTIPISSSGKSYGVYGFSNLTTVGGYQNGVYGSAFSSTALNVGRSYGVKGYAGNAGNGWNYAVHGTLAGSNNGAAIYGVVAPNGDVSTNGKYAGYFLGDMYIGGHLGINKAPDPNYDISTTNYIQAAGISIISDERFKNNIQDLTGSLAQVMNLKGVTYKLNDKIGNLSATIATVAVSDTGTVQYEEKIINAALYNRDHIGFLAQDMQKIFPDLVYEDKDGMLSVDYVSLIPVLVESLKEINLKLEALKKENEILKMKVGLY
jgi:hypothetical protein